MLKEIEQNKFIEHANVHGNLYGTSYDAVKDVAQAGKCVRFTTALVLCVCVEREKAID